MVTYALGLELSFFSCNGKPGTHFLPDRFVFEDGKLSHHLDGSLYITIGNFSYITDVASSFHTPDFGF